MSAKRHFRPAPPLVSTTANIAGPAKRAFKANAIEAALEGSHLLGVQELQRDDAESFVDRRFYGTLQGKHPDARGRCALYWQLDRLELLNWGVHLLHLSNLYPSADRFYVSGTFRDLQTGRRRTAKVVHFGPSSDDEHGGIIDTPRGKLVLRAIDVLVADTRATFGNLTVMGDFNINGIADLKHHDPTDLIERFQRAGLTSVGRDLGRLLPTHGTNAYDQAFVRETRGNGHPIAQWVRPKLPGMDHRALSFRESQTMLPGWKVPA